MERTDVPICQDPSEPEIPYKMDVCNVYAVFNDPTDRFISVGSTSARTDDPNGFFQHSLGADTAPACNLIPLFPALVCDSYVTVANECSGSGDGSTRDPDFDSTAFNTSGSVAGGWFNSNPSNGQGVPDANGRVLIAQFSVKQNKDVTGTLTVFATIGGAEDATEFPLQTFDCFGGGGAGPSGSGSGPVAQGAGGGSCVGDPNGGIKFCPDVELGGANEPAIAVNPLDPLNIAVTWNPDLSSPEISHEAQLTVSTDGGLSWSTPLDAPFPPGFCGDPAGCFNGDPSVAFDSDGRLFWGYVIFEVPSVTQDIAVVEVDPDTGLLSQGPFQVINDVAMPADKPWLTAGPLPTPQYPPDQNRLYVVWKNEGSELTGTAVSYADTADLNAWSTPQLLSPHSTTDETLPAHVAVGPTGIVYVAWHLQPDFAPNVNCPDGVSGQVKVRRSTDGGVNWEGATTPYPGGDADITWNAPNNCAGETIPNTRFCTAGSTQPWIVPDPTDGNRVYVIAADDHDNQHGDLDDSLIYIVRSGDSGVTWDDLDALDPIKEIEPNPQADMFQVFPTAAIDPASGDLVVLWYDNRNQQFFEDPDNPGNCLYYLDVFFSISTDHGENFSVPRQMNDVAFEHMRGAPWAGGLCPGAKHMGEYIGVALTTHPSSGTQYLYAAWTGNSIDEQQTIFGKAVNPGDECPWDLNDDGIVEAFDLAVLLGAWGADPSGPPDFNCDGDVRAFDLAVLLGRWGPCP